LVGAALLLAVAASVVDGRKNKLVLKRERRQYVVVSSFGLLMGGSITVNMNEYKPHGHVKAAGFSIHRSSERATEYNMNAANGLDCFMTAENANAENLMRIPIDSVTGAAQPIEESLSGVQVDYWKDWDSDKQMYEITLTNSNSEDMYSVAVHYCNESPVLVGSIDMVLKIKEMNPGPSYLGAGLAQIPSVYFSMAGLFALAALVWGMVVRGAWQSNAKRLFKVHYLMLALVITKSLSAFFHGVDYFYIDKTGTPKHGWAITYYVLHLAKGLILFLAIMLVGVGYGFVKHALSRNERTVFMIVIPLQVFANVAGIVIEESAEGSSARSTWRSISLLVDLICCGAILFPVVWSIRHLREASETDGKAKAALSKLRVFRKFYVMVLGYIYTTRIVVYLIESTIPFRYEWTGPMFNELTAFAFYVATGYMFMPEDSNDYLHVPEHDSDDDDNGPYPMEEVITTHEMADGLSKRGGGGASKGPSATAEKYSNPAFDAAGGKDAPQSAFEPDF